MPKTVVFKQVLLALQEVVLKPQVQQCKAVIAKRTRVWKLDCSRKAAIRVFEPTEETEHAGIMLCVSEEGFWCFPPRRIQTEGRNAWETVLLQELQEHKANNVDSEAATSKFKMPLFLHIHYGYNQALIKVNMEPSSAF